MFDPIKLSQPHLFDVSDTTQGVVELFPTVWSALEQLISNDVNQRHLGLGRLLELDAHKLSPLVAYMLATRLLDSDKKFRNRIIKALGTLLSVDDISPSASDEVIQILRNYLSKMRRRNIYGLLEISEDYPSSISHIVALLKPCSHAGGTLADIFSDRKIPIEIRRQAINLSGIVGFIDVIPSLERLAGRLESRTSGQRTMPFAPPEDRNEKSLLPTIQTALAILRSP